MTVLELLHRLHALGAVLTPYPDGTVRCRAPQGALTPVLVDTMRRHKAALHDVVEEWGERAAIMEYEGKLLREQAETMAAISLKEQEAHYQQDHAA